MEKIIQQDTTNILKEDMYKGLVNIICNMELQVNR